MPSVTFNLSQLDHQQSTRAITHSSVIFLSLFSIIYSLEVLGAVSATTPVDAAANSTPNILFIIMDDVGIDQMKVFDCGGADPAKTLTIDVYSGSRNVSL